VRARRLAAAAATLAACAALAASAGANHDTTELLSTGPAGGNGAFPAAYSAASSDGTRVFFQTNEQLVSGDTDARIDIYERAGGVTTLVSTGPVGGNGGLDASFGGISEDGSKVFFATNERLVSNDADTQSDVYQRAGGATTLISTSPTATGTGGSFFDGSSADGSHVFFHSRERLATADTDSQTDIYERSANVTTQVSTGPAGGNGAFDAFFGGTSTDGAHVFFETYEPLTADDTDSSQDVFDRSGGTTKRMSTWGTAPGAGNGAFDAFYDANSDNGSSVVYSTAEQLAPTDGDTDGAFDVYRRSGTSSALVSFGPIPSGENDALYAGSTPSLSHVWFTTDERMNGADTDSSRDVYENSASVRLISTGPAGGNGASDAVFDGASRDGLHVVFETGEALTAGDSDAQTDLYERVNGGFSDATTALVSTGAAGGNGPYDAIYGEISNDGRRIFFETDEQLSASDTDSSTDVYERADGATTLISTGPAGGNGASPAAFDGASTDGSRAFFETSESLVSGDTDTSLDLYSAAVNASFVRPRGATPFRVPLVPAYEPCSTPNRSHGAPLSFGSCASPAQSSSALTVGTPDSNGKGAQSSGSVWLRVQVGDPDPSADEADVSAAISLTDVRRRSDLADYTGQLQALLGVRLTDRRNGSAASDTGTVGDTSFSMTVPCTATADPAIGSACALSTTFDAVMPGVATEGGRAIWELGQVVLSDGGADGLAATAPNQPFMRQGVFVP
jgi:hypothetical protein